MCAAREVHAVHAVPACFSNRGTLFVCLLSGAMLSTGIEPTPARTMLRIVFATFVMLAPKCHIATSGRHKNVENAAPHGPCAAPAISCHSG